MGFNMKMLLTVLLSTLAFSAGATPLLRTYEFTATVNHIGNNRTYTYLDSSEGYMAGSTVAKNDTITGRVVYNSQSPLTYSLSFPMPDPSSVAPGGYQYGTAADGNHLTYTMVNSGHQFSTFANIMLQQATWYPHGDTLTLQGRDSYSAFVRLLDPSGNVFVNGYLPDSLEFEAYDRGIFVMNWYRPSDGASITGAARIDSFNEVGITNDVPEPGTFVMLLSGLAILGFGVRRSRKSK